MLGYEVKRIGVMEDAHQPVACFYWKVITWPRDSRERLGDLLNGGLKTS